MNATILRVYGAIAISILICLIFVICLFLAFWKEDVPMQQLLIGIAGAQFATAVGYWIGSSASSAQKDEKMEPPPNA